MTGWSYCQAGEGERAPLLSWEGPRSPPHTITQEGGWLPHPLPLETPSRLRPGWRALTVLPPGSSLTHLPVKLLLPQVAALII